MKKRNREGGKFFLILILLVVVIYCLYQLYDIYIPYFSGDKKYGRLQELARETGQNEDQVNETDQGRKNSSDKDLNSKKDSNNGTQTVINFKSLEEINADITAWITFDKPSEIDYPVVQGRDNQEYLTRTFDADGHKYGTIFIDVDNSPDFTDKNTFIYGHHMRNGSMFAGLLDYLDKAYYDQHPYFTIYTKDKRTLTYQVCSVEITAEATLSYMWKYDTEESWEEYRTYIMNNTQYNTGAVLDKDSRLVSLSTCLNTTTNQRVLLHGVLIGET